MAKTKKKFFSRIGDWFRGMKSELKKVVWPSWKQTSNNSIVVLVSVIATALVVWGIDSLGTAFVRILTDLIA